MDATTSTVYFEKKGPENTDKTISLAKKRADELGIKSILIATTKGDSAVKASEVFKGYNLVAVTHSTGFAHINIQELEGSKRKTIEENGGKILTSLHSFGGIGRAVRMKFNTYELEDIIANTLRVFGEGTKVAIEITMMATDAGLIHTTEDVVAIAGTGRGADTALVIKPANTQRFFDLKIKEIICKPLC
ncbi:MAG: hypothetical protein HY776_03280 [Actinobacteria bacterium]|nr:hypothetical protein [Actinomycetota bacterium]